MSLQRMRKKKKNKENFKINRETWKAQIAVRTDKSSTRHFDFRKQKKDLETEFQRRITVW